MPRFAQKRLRRNGEKRVLRAAPTEQPLGRRRFLVANDPISENEKRTVAIRRGSAAEKFLPTEQTDQIVPRRPVFPISRRRQTAGETTALHVDNPTGTVRAGNDEVEVFQRLAAAELEPPLLPIRQIRSASRSQKTLERLFVSVQRRSPILSKTPKVTNGVSVR